MRHEMLEAILVKRQALAERLVSKVTQSALTVTKHQTLLLGPRGIGKSYLLALVYHRVKVLPELAGKIAIAYFAEEEWSVASLADLLLVILKALEREYGGLRARIEALYRLPVREIENAAGALVREFVGERTLLILVENLDEIFRGLGSDGQWAFRSYLNERPFVTLLATTPSLFAGVIEHESAFYGFFQNIYLEELTVKEATELLGKVAERREDKALVAFLKTPTAQERVQAVHDLAGGHPRIYLLFAHLLTQPTLDELVTPFLKLLDELTPYYQSRMQLLSPQQRKIVEYLCGARGAVPVREIAAQNLMTSQTASGQLDKLEEMAYIRKTSVGRESWYELREPLLRMVIEVKRGRGEPIRLIVDFLRRWYSRSERRMKYESAPSEARITRQYVEAALDLRGVMEWKPYGRPITVRRAEYSQLDRTREFQKELDTVEEAIERAGAESTTEQWAYRGMCLLGLKRDAEALESCDFAITLNPNYAYAYTWRGNALSDLRRYEEALASYERAIELDPAYAFAYNGRGNALWFLRRYEEALASYERAIELDPAFASAYYNRGLTLSDLRRYEEALASHERAIELGDENAQYARSGIENLLRQARRTEIVQQVFSVLPVGKINPSDNASLFFRSILRQSEAQNEWPNLLSGMLMRFADLGDIGWVGQELTESLTEAFASSVTVETVEAWNAAWQEAGKSYSELAIPLRLLDAASQWRKKPDRRILLRLPIEERQVLEAILPT